MKKYTRHFQQDVEGNQPVGRPKTIDEQYLERLKELVSCSPKQFGYPFERWTAQWLGKHLFRETGVSISDRHVNRLLKQMGLSTRAHLPLKSFGITIDDLHGGRGEEHHYSF